MKFYCAKCQKIHAYLETEAVHDEVYEFCTDCKSDMDLHPVNEDGVTYTNRFNNEVHPITLKKDKAEKVKISPSKVWDESFEDYIERKQEVEDESLARYHSDFEVRGKEYADDNYHIPAVTRKFHLEGAREDFLSQRELEANSPDELSNVERELVNELSSNG